MFENLVSFFEMGNVVYALFAIEALIIVHKVNFFIHEFMYDGY